MYDPSTFKAKETVFFWAYNGVNQGPVTTTAIVQIDSTLNPAWTMTSSYELDAKNVKAVARADAIMTPVSATEYSTFGYLRSSANPTFSTGSEVSAWQDHPARTSYHTSLNDEVLHIVGEGANLGFVHVNASTNFNILAGRAVMGGFLI